jgi:hypothetical protein
MFGKEESSLLAAGGTQVKPLAGERAEISKACFQGIIIGVIIK